MFQLSAKKNSAPFGQICFLKRTSSVRFCKQFWRMRFCRVLQKETGSFEAERAAKREEGRFCYFAGC